MKTAEEVLCDHIVPCVDALDPLRFGEPIAGLDSQTADDLERLARDARALYEKLHSIVRGREVPRG